MGILTVVEGSSVSSQPIELPSADMLLPNGWMLFWEKGSTGTELSAPLVHGLT